MIHQKMVKRTNIGVEEPLERARKEPLYHWFKTLRRNPAAVYRNKSEFLSNLNLQISTTYQNTKSNTYHPHDKKASHESRREMQNVPDSMGHQTAVKMTVAQSAVQGVVQILGADVLLETAENPAEIDVNYAVE